MKSLRCFFDVPNPLTEGCDELDVVILVKLNGSETKAKIGMDNNNNVAWLL